jgi:hypothetical protein
MSRPAIRLVVEVYVAEDVRDAVITGTVTDADVRSDALDALHALDAGDAGDEAVRAFSGHLGLITAVEQAIGAAVGRRGTAYRAGTAYRRTRGEDNE